MTSFAKELLSYFPRARAVFAYGSGAFQQPGLYSASSGSRVAPMLDIIFAADNPIAWHHENMAMNGDHYSSVRRLHPSLICSLCDFIGRGTHFNPYSAINGQDIKYGTVSTLALTCDLWTWDSMFMAGRLHKPVLVLAEDALINEAMSANLDSALAAALLFLPAQFTSQALMEAICGLSYTGDIRMRWGEDKRKIQRIVLGSYPALTKMFSPHLQGLVGRAAKLQARHQGHALHDLKLDTEMEQHVDIPQTELLLSFLPETLQTRIGRSQEQCSESDAVGLRSAVAARLSKELGSIIRASSTRQAMWGIASAGPAKALRYAIAKARKHSGST